MTGGSTYAEKGEKEREGKSKKRSSATKAWEYGQFQSGKMCYKAKESKKKGVFLSRTEK